MQETGIDAVRNMLYLVSESRLQAGRLQAGAAACPDRQTLARLGICRLTHVQLTGVGTRAR